MLGAIFKVARDVVFLPVDVIKDVATLGMKKAHDGKLFTQDKLDKIQDDLDEIA